MMQMDNNNTKNRTLMVHMLKLAHSFVCVCECVPFTIGRAVLLSVLILFIHLLSTFSTTGAGMHCVYMF